MFIENYQAANVSPGHEPHSTPHRAPQRGRNSVTRLPGEAKVPLHRGAPGARLRQPPPAAAPPPPLRPPPPCSSVTTTPSVLEREAFPVRRAFAGVDLATSTLFIHLDQMSEVHYAPASQRGAVAPAQRLRDRHLHDRRRAPAPGLQRRPIMTDCDMEWMAAGAVLSIC
jgi:hypothetical protein